MRLSSPDGTISDKMSSKLITQLDDYLGEVSSYGTSSLLTSSFLRSGSRLGACQCDRDHGYHGGDILGFRRLVSVVVGAVGRNGKTPRVTLRRPWVAACKAAGLA